MREFTTLFDSFNARNLTLKQVARSFILHPKFDEIIRNTNSLLLGPRGCGKTTILKMLTIEAQIEYNRTFDAHIHNDIPFFAVYIPTDIQWKIEVENLQHELKGKTILINTLLNALINTNIYSSIISTFTSLSSIVSQDLLNKELVNFNIEVIKILKLPSDTSPSLYSIEQAVSERITYVNIIINKLRDNCTIDADSLPIYFSENFMDVLKSLCTAFEHYFSTDDNSIFVQKEKPFKWALCFDELELAPEFLQKQLIRFFRSKSQNFIFKLTSIPVIDIFEPGIELPSSNNDFNPVNLWLYNNSQEKSWEEFCKKLVGLKLKSKFNIENSPEKLFGSSALKIYLNTITPKHLLKEIDRDLSDEKKLLIIQMKELLTRDHTFREYLEKKKVNLKTLIPYDRQRDSEVHRKIAPLVVYRNHHLRENENTKSIRRRTRKIQNPFCYGWQNLCKIADGNPRLLIGLIENLLINSQTNPGYNKVTLDIGIQSSEIYSLSKKNLDVWSTHPNSSSDINNENLSLKNLIDHIGRFFSSQIISQEFSPSPVGTFIVDENINHKYISIIRLGLYLGAFVMLNPGDNLSVNSIINKRFRLSFILYPYYLLPIRVEERPNDLSKILKNIPTTNQKELWDSYGDNK